MPQYVDWKTIRRLYDIPPSNYEEILSIIVVGSVSCYSINFDRRVNFVTKSSWKYSAKYSFAHGGKDGVLYVVDRKSYDESIEFLHSSIEEADIPRIERIIALKKIDEPEFQYLPHDGRKKCKVMFVYLSLG